MTRWLVAGAGGMLGTDAVAFLRQAGHDVLALDRAALDVRDPEACRAHVRGVDVVLNAAAWTDVDGAEAHEAEAFDVNAGGAANLARACRAHDAVMVQVSTDYVFAGDATKPYPVEAPVAPRNAYGRGKAAGEWAVRAECPASYVVRTSWLYGANGHCFPRTMLRLAAERDSVEVVDDQVGQPTWTEDLVRFLVALVDAAAPFGIHHGTSEGSTTWFGLAREVFALAGHDPNRVRTTTSDRVRRAASRPSFSVLATDGQLPTWKDGLRAAMPQLLAR